MTFPELLNEYIRELNCTASELAEASGLTSASLSRYRNGQRMPEADTLKKTFGRYHKHCGKERID